MSPSDEFISHFISNGQIFSAIILSNLILRWFIGLESRYTEQRKNLFFFLGFSFIQRQTKEMMLIKIVKNVRKSSHQSYTMILEEKKEQIFVRTKCFPFFVFKLEGRT